ncbi:hypothetical protein [Parasphingorhabdus pacifica]
MLSKLRQYGVTSDVLLNAGLISIGLSFVSWMFSRQLEQAGVDRADRWGIFVGEWAPTFIALGAAMRVDERLRPDPPEQATGPTTERAGTQPLSGTNRPKSP